MSRRLPVVVPDDAAEPLLAAELERLDPPGAGRRLSARGRGEAEGRMGTLPVVVGIDVLAQQVVQVAGAEDDEVVEAFGLDALQEPLDVGVEVRRTERQGMNRFGPRRGPRHPSRHGFAGPP